MSPEEFVSEWGLSRRDLADLLDVSIGTVNHWLMLGASRRNPSSSSLRRIAEIHSHFLIFKNEPPHLREAYDRLTLKK